MAISPTYPGVYIEEVPSQVRTITGVSTAVTAFVGYTKRGPINKAVNILSFADFERKFGGLCRDSPVSYAVQHFFMNGGQQAYVVRITQAGTASLASVTLQNTAETDVLTITAHEPGAWANGMLLTVDYNTAHPDSTFNLRVVDPSSGRSEEFLGVTMDARSRRNVSRVVADSSQLIEVTMLASASGQGYSWSGSGINVVSVDAEHRQFMITLDEDDGPQLVTIYDGAAPNRPTTLVELATRIQNAVQTLDPGEAVYSRFECRHEPGLPDATGDRLILTSGLEGNGSFVRLTSAGALDAARLLRLGVANGGREVDAAAAIRPAAVGATSGEIDLAHIDFSTDRELFVSIDGDGPHPVTLFAAGIDPVPAGLNALRDLLATKIKRITPFQRGSMAFMGTTVQVVGNRLQLRSGAANLNSIVTIENARIIDLLNAVFLTGTDAGYAVGDNGTILQLTSGAWSEVASDLTAENLNAVFLTGTDAGYAVRDNGTILHLNSSGWSIQRAVTDNCADALHFTASEGGCQNVKTYTLGIGRILGAQRAATPGQDGSPPQPRDYHGSEADKTGIYALQDVDLFNILCLPDVTELDVLSTALAFCQQERAFLIIDCPASWRTLDEALTQLTDYDSLRSENAALYFPRVQMADPLDDNKLRTFPPCGIVAGIYARTDVQRGVWKAPAGQEATLAGVQSLVYTLTDRENGLLNPLGVNCLRAFPVFGPVIWGARTLEGADVLASEWKYIPVRRLALFIEESLYRGTHWVVFEPNDEPLWAKIRLNVGAFMTRLFRQGAFQGSTPNQAFFVKCDSETTTQADRNLGIVNIVVGFAPLKPAEFVIIKIQQIAGQL